MPLLSRGIVGIAAVGFVDRCKGLPVVIQCWCLEDDAERSHHAGRGENPEEQAIQNHGDVLPVLHYLLIEKEQMGAIWVGVGWKHELGRFLHVDKIERKKGELNINSRKLHLYVRVVIQKDQ